MNAERIAPHNLYGRDGAGVRRFVAAGDPVPIGLEVEGDVDFGKEDLTAEEKRIAAEKARRGDNVAPHDMHGWDGAGLRRFVRGGDPIPEGLSLTKPAHDPLDPDSDAELDGAADGQGPIGSDEPATSEIVEQQEGLAAASVDAQQDEGDQGPDAVGETPNAPDAPVAAPVPFEGYDEASPAAVKKRLGESTPDQVEAIKAYEREHRNRPSIVNYGA